MVYIETGSVDAAWNLACEEYVLTSLPFDSVLMLWQNANAVIVGRYQIAESEVNQAEARMIGADIVRRISGGGAVYHDLGNLNYTLISKAAFMDSGEISKQSAFIVDALVKLGIPAEFEGRNDVTVLGRKVSGAAQTFQNDRLLHHGTLLFSSDLQKLSRVLSGDPRKFEGKHIKSIRQRVGNIKELCELSYGIEEFWREFKRSINNEIDEYSLTNQDKLAIDRLRKDKYCASSWNFGAAPDYNFENSIRTDIGTVGCRLQICDGVIELCRLFGDFLGVIPVEDIQNSLTGTRYDKESIRSKLAAKELDLVHGGVTANELQILIIDY